MTDQAQQQPTFDLRRVYLKDASLEIPNAPAVFLENEAPKVNIEISIETRTLDSDAHEVDVTATLSATSNDKTFFLVEAKQSGVFEITGIEGELIHVASAVETGQVLRIMRPGDLIGQTTRDLAAANARVGGMSAFLAFSCIGRHWEAAARGLEDQLGLAYAAYPTVGFQSFGEQSGMLLCNHTLTGVAIGKQATPTP